MSKLLFDQLITYMNNPNFKTHIEVLHNLNIADWDSLWPSLVKYSSIRCAKYYWRGARNVGIFTKGYQPEDFVQQAILKAYSGKVRWNEYRPELRDFLLEVIRKEIHNLAKSSENKDSSKEGDINLFNNFTIDTHFYLENEYIINLILMKAKAHKNKLVIKIANCAIYHGVSSNEDLSEVLNEDIELIKNARRSYRSIIRKIKLEELTSNKIVLKKS